MTAGAGTDLAGTPSAAAAGVVRPAPYFVNLPVDAALIGGGSIVLFLLMPLFQDGTRTATVIQVGLWLTWVGNWPHFAATSYRLYSRRDHLRQYPITAVAAPLIVVAGGAASLAWPQLVAPCFVKLFLLWSAYHYSGQTLGISLLYGRRAGHRPEALERFLLSAFIYGTYLMRTLAGESNPQAAPYYGVAVPTFGLPRAVATGFTVWTYACAAAFVALLLWRALQTRRAPPGIYLLPAATQYVWFVIAGAKPGYSEFVPFFHGLQYLVIAWAMQIKEQVDRGGALATLRSIGGASLRWYLAIVVGGAALFYGLPHLLAATGVELNLATAVVLAAIQIHHFFVDGVIWKLRTRSVTSPLLVNIPQLLEAPALQPAAGLAA